MSFNWFNYLNCNIEAISLLVFWQLLSDHTIRRTTYILIYILLGIISLVPTLIDSVLFSILPINFLLIFLCFYIGCRSISWKDNILQTIFSYSSLLFLQALLLCLLPSNILGTQWGNLLVNIIVFFVSIILMLLEKRFHFADLYHHNIKIAWFFLISLFLPELVIAQFFLVNVQSAGITNMVMLILIQSLYTTLLILFLLAWNQRMRQKQLIATQKYISSLNEHLNNSRQKAHDFHKHLRHLRRLVDTASDTKSLSHEVDLYCMELMQEYDKDDILLQLDNPTFRALLFGRQSQAARMNIQFILNASTVLPDFPLKNYQLVEVFDNLMDNAFECVAELSEENRWIRVTLDSISKKDGTITDILSIENPYETLDMSALVSQEQYTSKKGTHQGVGLYNVSKIIRHTGGQLIINQHNDSFIVKMIYIHSQQNMI